MDTNKVYRSAVTAAYDYFGPRSYGEGVTNLSGWMAEWKELSPADQAEIKQGLVALGYKIEEEKK